MVQHASVEVDHITVYCKTLEVFGGVCKALGFVTRDDKHYMLRKNYLEGYAPGPGERYPFFNSEGGLHSLIFWSDDPDGGYQRLTQAGYEMAMPVMDYSRPAEKDGKRYDASFRGSYFKTELFPLGESAMVKQMTKDLIYLEHPDEHPNTAYAMEEMYLCLPEDQQKPVAENLEKACALVRGNGQPHTCMNDLTLADADYYEKAFKVRVEPSRSCVTGIRFSVEDMDKAKACIAASGLPWHQLDGMISVDAAGPLNLFLLFAQK